MKIETKLKKQLLKEVETTLKKVEKALKLAGFSVSFREKDVCGDYPNLNIDLYIKSHSKTRDIVLIDVSQFHAWGYLYDYRSTSQKTYKKVDKYLKNNNVGIILSDLLKNYTNNMKLLKK